MQKPSTLSRSRQNLLAARARRMRRALTEPERRLWAALSRGQLGVVFRRQVVLGQAIADFFAPELRLVVEVDGAQHERRRARDARRDRELRRLGCVVLRVEARVVLENLAEAVTRAREAVEALR